MPGSSIVRTLVAFAMNVLFVVAIVLTGRIVVEFFGALAMTAAGQAIVELTEWFVLPLGITAARTPYGGVFDADAAVTVVVVLLAEWVLSIVRARG